ncbi:MAG: LamG-like jellyroll fold domain-containing protein [Eubacteriales bacterium]
MKKIIALFLVVVLVSLMIAGCGGTKNDATTNGGATTAPVATSNTEATTVKTTVTSATTATTSTTQATTVKTEATTEATTEPTTAPEIIPGDEYSKDLVAYWNFEKIEDDMVYDVTGRGNDGYVSGNPTIVDGIHGKAISLSKLGQHIDVLDSDDLDFGKDDNFTFEAVFKWNGTAPDAWPCIMNRGLMIPTKEYRYYGFWINNQNGIPQLGITNANANGCLNIPANGTIDTNWHTFTAVQEDGEISFYIDGVFQKSSDAIDAVSSQKLFIGYNGNSGDQGQFIGLIDEIKIYNCAIPESVIENR